jgi:hypothetical protein
MFRAYFRLLQARVRAFEMPLGRVGSALHRRGEYLGIRVQSTGHSFRGRRILHSDRFTRQSMRLIIIRSRSRSGSPDRTGFTHSSRVCGKTIFLFDLAGIERQGDTGQTARPPYLLSSCSKLGAYRRFFLPFHECPAVPGVLRAPSAAREAQNRIRYHAQLTEIAWRSISFRGRFHSRGSGEVH